MEGEISNSSAPMCPPHSWSSYRVTQESLAGVSHCSQGIVHISLARQAADTTVQGLGHRFSHLRWKRGKALPKWKQFGRVPPPLMGTWEKTILLPPKVKRKGGV